MTEEEAKKKWCPFARAQQFQSVHNVSSAIGEPVADNPAVNRDTMNVNCIGSACMAWRVSEMAYFDRWGRPVKATDNAAVKEKDLGGICGLAG